MSSTMEPSIQQSSVRLASSFFFFFFGVGQFNRYATVQMSQVNILVRLSGCVPTHYKVTIQGLRHRSGVLSELPYSLCNSVVIVYYSALLKVVHNPSCLPIYKAFICDHQAAVKVQLRLCREIVSERLFVWLMSAVSSLLHKAPYVVSKKQGASEHSQ